MDAQETHDEETVQVFDQKIKALITVMAEICVHEYLTSIDKETDHVEQQ